jgi:hypothetical protein
MLQTFSRFFGATGKGNMLQYRGRGASERTSLVRWVGVLLLICYSASPVRGANAVDLIGVRGAVTTNGSLSGAAPSSSHTPAAPRRHDCCRSTAALHQHDTVFVSTGGEEESSPQAPGLSNEAFLTAMNTVPPGLTTRQELEWWESHHSATDANLTFANLGMFWGGGASRAQINRTTADYRRRLTALGAQATPQQRVQALIDAVEAEMSRVEGNVCRHYSYLLYYVARDMGYPVQFRCYGLTGSGHCWNVVTIDGVTFVVSANWGFYYQRP